MASSDLGPTRPATHDALPGRRRRRRRSKRRRFLRLIEPFAILGGLLVLSVGVIKVVETGVPTHAAATDSRRLARAQVNTRAEIEALAASLEEGWIPVVEEFEDDLFNELLVVHDDPLLQLERSPRRPARRELDPDEWVDQLTTSSSSTSNTSAAPPGIVGGAPESP